MSERDWTGELERYLRDRFADLCATIGQAVPSSGLRINPPFGIEESKYFLLGMEAGLFLLDEEGYVQSELLHASSTGTAEQKACRIFRHEPPPGLCRESVCQLSTASLLILKRGWLRSHILMEPDFQDQRGTSYGMDILVKSPAGPILICVEVKRTVAELEKMMTDLRTCCKRGAHASNDCGFPQNHPKYEFCAFYKPTYFWGVAPEVDVCFRMKYNGDSIELEQLSSLPPRSMIESN